MEAQNQVMRHFSESFKKEKVKQIEAKQVTVLQLSRIYEVSTTAIYNWIRKYSKHSVKRERVVVEKESEAAKTLRLLRKVAELEQIVGQKQVEIEYLNKIIELGSELTEVDIKKKFGSKS